MRIGVFGGSFNPVHQGHIRLADEAFSELNLDKLYFVPSRENPLKKKDMLLPETTRIRLLRAAIGQRQNIFVSLCEIRRKGPSFTVDTLKFFRKKFGKEAVLYCLCGADILPDIERWKSPDKIFKLCWFVVMTRPGYGFQKSKRPVLYLPFSAIDMSSSEIRRRLKSGQSIRSLVPELKTKGGLISNRIRKLI